MKFDIIPEISTLTTIKQESLDKLFKLVSWCISDGIEQSLLKDENTTELNLGFGKLLISVVDNNIKYKFLPSSDLEKGIIDTAIYGKNPLKANIDKQLVNNITNIYKELL